MLHEFLSVNTPEIIARTRVKLAARTSPVPTDAQLENGVPVFLTQLIDRLRLTTLDNEAIEASAALHGGELLAMGFTVSQVVHCYGDVCQVITQLADDRNISITAEEFKTFHLCLDDAMAHAVTEYQRRRDASVASEGTARFGVLAQQLQTRLGSAMQASALLKKGNVSVGGSTGAMIGRSLRGMRTLVTDALVDTDPVAELDASLLIAGPERIGETDTESF
jgi:hypothetical protein